MSYPKRMRVALKAAGIQFSFSLLVAGLAAGLVFFLWYPYPYQEMAGGRELFLIVVAVDVVCGPLLTSVIFNPSKPRQELWRDLCTVAIIQLAALSYGLWSVWQARPLFLVQEIDRFKIIGAPDLLPDSLVKLPSQLRPGFFEGPMTIAIRKPKSIEEKNGVLFDAIEGGRDYAERPEFYISYEGEAALQSLQRALPLSPFLDKYPDQMKEAREIAKGLGKLPSELVYLPVVSRQDWIAVLDTRAQVVGFLKGDGF